MKSILIHITKGRDSYLDITPLSDYCLQRGWKVKKEVVTIALPQGKELEELLKDLRSEKIRVVESKGGVWK